MLVGRDPELARLETALASARRGKASVVVVSGEAGIGKTSLLDVVCERAGGMRVLRSRGVANEAEVPLAVLFDVVRPLLSEVDQIPERQAAVLRGAFALGPTVDGDRFILGASTLSLLAHAAEAAPLLVVVDDAHWMDAGSADALRFAARRLDDDAVAMVFAVRPDHPTELRNAALPMLELAGLEPAVALELARGNPAFAGVDAEQLMQLTGGNPLAILELTWPARGLGEAAPRAPTAVEDAFVERLENLTPRSRRALLVSATDDVGRLEVIAAGIESLGGSIADLEPAESAGLVSMLGDVIRFRHPLVRSAVYRSATSPERRSVHAALADATSATDPTRSAWHRAASITRPDEQAAEAMVAVANDAATRNSYSASAAALRTAARLTQDPRRRAERLLASAHAAWDGGNTSDARCAVAEALDLDVGPLVRADAVLYREHIRAATDGTLEGKHAFLTAEAERVLHHDRTRAARLLALAADAAQYARPGHNLEIAYATAKRAWELVEIDADPTLTSQVLYPLSQAAFYYGHLEEARGYTRRLLELALTRAETSQQAGVHLEAAQLFDDTEDEASATVHAERAVELARAGDRVGLLPHALWRCGEFSWWCGNWMTADSCYAEGLTLARDLGQGLTAAWLTRSMAMLAASRGQEQQALELLRETLRAAHLDPRMTNGKPYVLSELGLSGGRPDEVIAIVEPFEPTRQRYPGPWPLDLAEAYIRAGRISDAERAVAEASQTAQHRSTIAALDRCRGLLADEDFDHLFERSATAFHEIPLPLHEGRTLLCHGERLRRSRRVNEARDQLSRALEIFDRLGAAAWAERARAELRASGATIRAPKPARGEDLTPQEYQVAMLAAQGKTNNEVGAALFLSPKTIEAHLGRVYRKLGLRSRTELARALDNRTDA